MTWRQQFWAIALGVAVGDVLGRIWADLVYSFGILWAKQAGWWP